MQISVRFSGSKRSDFGTQEFEQVFSDSLERFARELKQVVLYVEDVNGPKGGRDKQCRCVVYMRRMSPIVIQDTDETMQTLLSRVANRAAYAVSQKLARKNDKRRTKGLREVMTPSAVELAP